MSPASTAAVEPTPTAGVSAPDADLILSVAGLTKSYPSDSGPVLALANIDVQVRAGEFVSIVGPSGCGKSTLLNCIAGLLDPSGGKVLVNGKPVSGGPPEGMSVVFQDYSRSLFQWYTVEKNVMLPLASSGVSRAKRRETVRRMLADVRLPETVVGRYPWQLSGGMQQRVAIARGLVSHPEIVLMDEPFASVDAQTRMSLEDLVLELWSSWKKSILFVTHDIDEAVYLSDKVVVLSPGPSNVKAVIDIPLPRPRRQLETKRLPEFAELRSGVLELILDADEASAAGARGLNVGYEA